MKKVSFIFGGSSVVIHTVQDSGDLRKGKEKEGNAV